MGKLTNSGDIRIVQAIGRAHTELDLVHTHVEQLLELDVFFAHASRCLVELDYFFVVVHKDIEVVPQNRRRLEQCVIRRQTSVGPDFENELVVIGALTDPGVFDGILDTRDRRKNRIDRDNSDSLIGTLIFLAGGEATTDAHIKLGIKFMFFVESADHLLRVEHFKTLNGLDVAGGHFAFLVHDERKFLRLVILTVHFEFHFLEVEDDVGDVLDDAG